MDEVPWSQYIKMIEHLNDQRNEAKKRYNAARGYGERRRAEQDLEGLTTMRQRVENEWRIAPKK